MAKIRLARQQLLQTSPSRRSHDCAPYHKYSNAVENPKSTQLNLRKCSPCISSKYLSADQGEKHMERHQNAYSAPPKLEMNN